jgi:hypothetical protein
MSNDYYSKKNPRGPYTGTIRPGAAADKPSDYIEGFSTPKNIKEWAAYASKNSGPGAAPGLGKKTEPAPIRKPLNSPDE